MLKADLHRLVDRYSGDGGRKNPSRGLCGPGVFDHVFLLAPVSYDLQYGPARADRTQELFQGAGLDDHFVYRGVCRRGGCCTGVNRAE